MQAEIKSLLQHKGRTQLVLFFEDTIQYFTVLTHICFLVA